MNPLALSQAAGTLSLKDKAGIIEWIGDKLPDDLAAGLKAATDDVARRAFLDEKRGELIDRIPEEYRFLVSRVADFDEKAVDLFDLSAPLNSARGAFAVGTSAALRFERLSAQEVSDSGETSLPDDMSLLRIQLSGNFDLSASLKGTNGILDVGLSSASSSNQKLSYYLIASNGGYLAEVLPELSGLMMNPADLGDVIDVLKSTSLTRVERTADSLMTLGLKLAISRDIKRMISGLSASGSVGGSLSLTYKDSSEFSLIVDQTPDDTFVIELRKTRIASRNSVLKLGVDLRVDGFKEKLLEQITQVLPEDTRLSEALQKIDEVQAKLEADVLHDEIKTHLTDKWPNAKPAIDFLVGRQTATDLATDIQKELQDRIDEEVSTRVDVWNDDAKAAGKKVAGAISDRLGLTGELRAKLDDYIADGVEKGMASAQEKLESVVSDHLKSEDLTAVLEPWTFLGESVEEAVVIASKKTLAKVRKVTAALRKIEARYARFRQAVLARVKDNMENDLAITIVSEKDRTQTRTRTLRYEMRDVSSPAKALYRALWSGNLADFGEMAAKVMATPETIALDGEYRVLSESVSKLGLNINFFGARLAASRMFGETVNVAINLNGQLVAAESKAELEKIRSRFGETQSVRAAWRVDYLRTNVLDAPLTIQIKLKDNRFKAGGEVEDFLSVLEEVGVMRAGIAGEVDRKLFAGGLREIRNATLKINVALRWGDWLRMVGTAIDGRDVDRAWQPKQACDDFIAYVGPLAPAFIREPTEYMEEMGMSDLTSFLYHLGKFKFDDDAMRFVGERRKSRPKFRTSRKIGEAVYSIHAGLTSLQSNWEALVARLPEDITDEEIDGLSAEISAVNNAVSQTFGYILSTGAILDDVGENTWLTAGALKLLLVNSDMPNPFVSFTFESEKTGQLLFS